MGEMGMRRIQSFISNKHFFTFMMSAFLLVSLILSFFIFQNFTSMDSQKNQLDKLSNDIEKYDLNLTNESILFILTGDQSHYSKYLETNTELEKTITTAKDTFPSLENKLTELQELNDALLIFEKEAMDNQNSQILSSNEYNLVKNDFKKNTIELQNLINQLNKNNQQNFVRTLVLLLVFGGLFLILIISVDR